MKLFFKAHSMKIQVVLLMVTSFSLGGIFIANADGPRRNITLGMENTIQPLLNDIALKACYGNAIKKGSASIIYKREPAEFCTSGTGNYLYARCYTSEWKSNILFYTPTNDIPLERHTRSCIDEDDVNIPYYDIELARAELNVPYIASDIRHLVNN